jgi:hypothetical protein
MMCICGSVLPANAKQCPSCGGSFNFSSTPVLRPRRTTAGGAPKAKSGLNPTIVAMFVFVFVFAVLAGAML